MPTVVLFAPALRPVYGPLMRTLRARNVQVLPTFSWKQLIEQLAAQSPEVLLLDLAPTEVEPAAVISMVRLVAPATRIIAYSPDSTPEDAAAVEGGVFFYAAGGDERYLADVVNAALQGKGATQRKSAAQ